MWRPVVLSALALLGAPLAHAVPVPAETRAIDQQVRALDARLARSKGPDCIAADFGGEAPAVSEEGTETPPPEAWRLLRTEAALEKARAEQEAYDIAYLWFGSGKAARRVVVARFTHFSSSGDWAQFDTYYFRDDGTLAHTESVHNTFVSDPEHSAQHLSWYDKKGAPFFHTVLFSPLQGRGTLGVAEGLAAAPDTPIYATTRDLPFAPLLRSDSRCLSHR